MRALVFITLVACGSDNASKLDELGKQQTERMEKRVEEKLANREPVKPDAAKPDVAKPDVAKPDVKPVQPGLTVVMDGKPIAVRAVNAANYSDGEIKIEFKNYDETCDPMTKGSSSRSSEPTDLDFTIRAGRYLHADGTLGWAMRGIYWHPSREKGSWTKQTEWPELAGKPFPKELVLDASAGTSFEIPVAIEMDMDDEDLKKKRTLSIQGTAKVSGCGDAKLKRDRVLPPPQPGTITIAKQELPIVGAALAVKKDGSRELTVATGEVICVEGTDYASAKWPDVEVHLTWGKDGKAQSASHAGGWVAWAGNAPFGTLSAAPNRPANKAKEMAITLGGATTIGGFPVELKGKIKALVCQP